MKKGLTNPQAYDIIHSESEVSEMAWKKLKVTFEAYVLVDDNEDENKAIQDLLIDSELDDWLEMTNCEVCEFGG